MNDRWSLKGKRALVTGGTKGIGRATAESLMELGAQVLVVGRDPDTVEATRRAWWTEGRGGDAAVADVTTPEGRGRLRSPTRAVRPNARSRLLEADEPRCYRRG